LAYLIKSVLEFNFQIGSNQDSIDLNTGEWSRNTTPYNLIDGTLRYEYLDLPNDLKQTVDITSTTPGAVDSVGISTGGDFYQIGESVRFKNSSTQGSGAVAKVSVVEGKEVF